MGSAIFDVSRQAEARERTMKVVYPSGELEIDFLTRAFRNTTGFTLDPDFAETPAARDTLGASIEGFLAAVRGEAPRPIVTAAEAIRALDLALAVDLLPPQHPTGVDPVLGKLLRVPLAGPETCTAA